jgi:vitamin B12 transport system substrate-binding protein
MTRVLALLLALSASPWLGAAERVVSLAPSLSEIMLELDAKTLLVGVLDGGERPASLEAIPSVGRMGQLEMESLLEPCSQRWCCSGQTASAVRSATSSFSLASRCSSLQPYLPSEQLAEQFARDRSTRGAKRAGTSTPAPVFNQGLEQLRQSLSP